MSHKQPNIDETRDVDGGHTVRTYGSFHADGVDAIQLEIASTLRDDSDKRAAFIENLAYAIGNFAARYVNTQSIPRSRRPFSPRSNDAASQRDEKRLSLLVFYAAFDSMVGISTGVLVSLAQTVPGSQQAIAGQLVDQFWQARFFPPIGLVILIADLAWVIALGTSAVAWRRAGHPGWSWFARPGRHWLWD